MSVYTLNGKWGCSMRLGVMVLSLLAASLPGRAGVIFTLGNDPQQPDEENILFNSDQTGSTIIGFTNQSNLQVNFSSTTDILIGLANGQATATAQDGLINNLSITPSNGDIFTDLILNPFSGGTSAGDAMVTVTTNDGVFTYSYPGGLVNGDNFLTITTTGGEFITSATIDSTGGFDSLKQPRISGLGPASGVPEPGTFGLMAGALLAGIGMMRRRYPSA